MQTIIERIIANVPVLKTWVAQLRESLGDQGTRPQTATDPGIAAALRIRQVKRAHPLIHASSVSTLSTARLNLLQALLSPSWVGSELQRDLANSRLLLDANVLKVLTCLESQSDMPDDLLGGVANFLADRTPPLTRLNDRRSDEQIKQIVADIKQSHTRPSQSQRDTLPDLNSEEGRILQTAIELENLFRDRNNNVATYPLKTIHDVANFVSLASRIRPTEEDQQGREFLSSAAQNRSLWSSPARVSALLSFYERSDFRLFFALLLDQSKFCMAATRLLRKRGELTRFDASDMSDAQKKRPDLAKAFFSSVAGKKGSTSKNSRINNS